MERLNEYLISLSIINKFEFFKQFLVKYRRIEKTDEILKEIKGFPYGIIIKSGNNLFKYQLEPYSEHLCKIIIKDLIDGRSMALHIQNIFRGF